jgi:predicted nucleic acid-binding Zn ribbon protein
MPLHRYQCATCAKDIEPLIGISETPICAGCAGRKLERCRPTPAAST